ncbi:MAG: hypothetical protein OXN89_11755 [Bryobacterales bacterium]|nr:hypothetical protein [Bryobacterales bacterium]
MSTRRRFSGEFKAKVALGGPIPRDKVVGVDVGDIRDVVSNARRGGQQRCGREENSSQFLRFPCH